MSFDVVVSTGVHTDRAFKELEICDCVSSVVDNVIGYRNIYVINCSPHTDKDLRLREGYEAVIFCATIPEALCDFYLWVEPTVRFNKPISFMVSSSGPALWCWPNTVPAPRFALLNRTRVLECAAWTCIASNSVAGSPEGLMKYLEFMVKNYEKEILFHHLRGGTRKGDYDFIVLGAESRET